MEKWTMGPDGVPVLVSDTPAPVDQQEKKITQAVIMGTFKGKTAAQWRSEGTTREHELCAQLAEKGGIWEFPGLFTLTGALVPDSAFVRVRTTGRMVWRIGKVDPLQWFTPSQALSGARRRANDASKGYQVGTIRQRAYVAVTARGWYIREVADSPIEIVDNGSLGTQYRDR